MRRVFAIDPGTFESAFCLYDGTRPVKFGKMLNARVLEEFAELGNHFDPHPELCVEMIASYGMPVGKEVFETCVWIGRFLQCWHRRAPSRRVTRKQVVTHVCGSAKAKDSNVRQALLDHVGPVGNKAAPGPTYGVSGDVWAALAVAVYAFEVPE